MVLWGKRNPAVGLSLGFAVTYGCVGVGLPYGPLWMADRGLSVVEIGLLTSLGSLAKLIASGPFGNVADRVGRPAFMILIAVTVGMIGHAAYLFAESSWHYAIIAFTVGLFFPNAFSVMEGIASRQAALGRLDYGRVRLWGSVGFLAASLATGVILRWVDPWIIMPMMVAGMVMVGSLIANKSPVKMTQTVPVARLTGEFQALVVPDSSPIKTAQDFVAALKADPTKVSVAGGSAGGSDHILLGMIGKAAGVAPGKLSYVAYAGGGPAQAALLGSHVTAGISGYGEFAEQIKAGKLRAIAISADKRQPGIDIPTLKEQGIDVELFNWRGVFAPPGTSTASRDALIGYIERMVKSEKWQEEAAKRDWTTILLTGDAYAKFLDDEITRIEAILKDLGLTS